MKDISIRPVHDGEILRWCDPNTNCKSGYQLNFLTWKHHGHFKLKEIVNLNNTTPIKIDGLMPGYPNSVRITPQFNCSEHSISSDGYVYFRDV